MTKRCKICRKALRCDNRSGYCVRHYKISPVMKLKNLDYFHRKMAKIRRLCGKCRKRTTQSKRGYCRSCAAAARMAAMTPEQRLAYVQPLRAALTAIPRAQRVEWSKAGGRSSIGALSPEDQTVLSNATWGVRLTKLNLAKALSQLENDLLLGRVSLAEYELLRKQRMNYGK